jgi:prophage antirepressor-like protein
MLTMYKGHSFEWQKDDAGEPIILASSVVEYLGGSSPNTARIVKTLFCIKFSGGKSGRSPWYLYEPGLYELILSPILANSAPSAVRDFKRWIFKDLLPSIRREGAYISTDITQVQAIAVKEKIDRILDSPDPWKKLYQKEFCIRVFSWFGAQFYWDFCYEWMTPEERCKINQLNVDKKKAKIHQYIEPETKERLKPYLYKLDALVNSVSCKEDFLIAYCNCFGSGWQLSLF